MLAKSRLFGSDDVHLSAAGEAAILMSGGDLHSGCQRQPVILERSRRIGVRERQNNASIGSLLGSRIDEESAVGETGDSGVAFRYQP